MISFPDLRPKPAVRQRTDEATGNGEDTSRKPNELAPTDATEEDTLPQSQQHLHREAGDGAASISHTTDEETSSLFDANDLSFNANSNPPATPAATAVAVAATTTTTTTNDDDSSSPIAIADIGSIPAESESSPTATVPPKPEAAPRESKQQQKQLEEPLAE